MRPFPEGAVSIVQLLWLWRYIKESKVIIPFIMLAHHKECLDLRYNLHRSKCYVTFASKAHPCDINETLLMYYLTLF